MVNKEKCCKTVILKTNHVFIQLKSGEYFLRYYMSTYFQSPTRIRFIIKQGFLQTWNPGFSKQHFYFQSLPEQCLSEISGILPQLTSCVLSEMEGKKENEQKKKIATMLLCQCDSYQGNFFLQIIKIPLPLLLLLWRTFIFILRGGHAVAI